MFRDLGGHLPSRPEWKAPLFPPSWSSRSPNRSLFNLLVYPSPPSASWSGARYCLGVEEEDAPCAEWVNRRCIRPPLSVSQIDFWSGKPPSPGKVGARIGSMPCSSK
ncbi:hypothetical protein CDAR_238201 [Caerostris darwini]|uniref:Uncharacterized protein n=1 Tax=Caerostris darwini TaxID=1538125 RepID=A0AAV4TPU7_9ARAC|nr:hypothetical protein CDAR_238201 [Caerostris darwini]